MIQKLKNLDKVLDQLDEINNVSFLQENFKKVNSDLETILFELKSEEKYLEKNKNCESYLNIFNTIWKKIEKLETKILPKANLLDSFKSSNP